MAAPFVPVPDPDPVTPRALVPRPGWWIAAVVLMGGGLAALVVAVVMIDATSGRFGRVPVPGSVVGDPQPGTYVVADGEYQAREHAAPRIVVFDPDGLEIPVERTDPIVGAEDNAIAQFVVERSGPHTVIAQPGADRTVPMARTVVVARHTKEVGPAATGAIVVILFGLLACAIGSVVPIVTIVRSIRVIRRRRRAGSPWPTGPAGWPPSPDGSAEHLW